MTSLSDFLAELYRAAQSQAHRSWNRAGHGGASLSPSAARYLRRRAWKRRRSAGFDRR